MLRNRHSAWRVVEKQLELIASHTRRRFSARPPDSLSLEQRQAQQHPRLLRIEPERRDEVEAVVLHFDVAADFARGHARRADAHDPLLRLRGERLERGLRHVAVADAGDHDPFRTVRGGGVDQRAVHVLVAMMMSTRGRRVSRQPRTRSSRCSCRLGPRYHSITP